jgi:hypothetical protein
VSPDALRSLERLHGIAAWGATAAVIAAAGLFARGARSRRAAGVVAAVLAAFAAGLGLALHDPYRAHLRQRLFVEAPRLGWLFEQKLHAAFAAVLLSLCALALTLRLGRGPAAGDGARDLHRAAVLGWAAAAALALGASIASTLVAARAHF